MRVLIGLVLVFGLAASGFGEMRTWTSKTGQTLEAEYARNTMDTVWLKTPTGKQKKIPISAFSKADQDYIYSQTPPKIEISVDNNIKRRDRPGDIDDVFQDLQCEYEIVKTSKWPYPGELTVYYFMVGWQLETKEYWVIETHQETFKLNDKNGNKYYFKGELFELWFDPDDPPRGKKFKGILVCVQTSDGELLEYKGRNLTEKHLKYLMNASRNDRFDDDWKKL